MVTIEQVEKLREKANITYEEARQALDASGGDLLDAMIYLEQRGKVQAPANAGYYSHSRQEEQTGQARMDGDQDQAKGKDGETFSSLMGRFFRWCGMILVKGNTNTFEVTHRGEPIISVPVTILVVLLILAFWVVLPLIIIGLFFNCRYTFHGPDLGRTEVNKVMDSAAEAAENIKNDVAGSSKK